MPQSMAQQKSMYDEDDDIAQREAIATEEQNYRELSQTEKRHAARVEALRDDEVEEDDSYERPRSLKKLHPKVRKVRQTKKGKKAHHKKSHSVKPARHQRAHQTMHASDFENDAAPVSRQGQMDSDEFSDKFSRGRFDTSETLGQVHHGHAKKHHMTHKRKHNSAPRQQAVHIDQASEMEYESKLKRDYNMRLAEANKFDGLVHLPNGKRMFVDDGTTVGGVNLSQKKHEKHPSQHKGHKKAHKTHKKHASHKSQGHKKHEASQVHENKPEPQATAHFAQEQKGAVKKMGKHHGHKKHATAHHAKTHKKEEASD